MNEGNIGRRLGACHLESGIALRIKNVDPEMYSDEIIDAVGGMSRFQIMIIGFALGPKTITAWGMLMMSFAGVTPDKWWCTDSHVATNVSEYTGLKECPAPDNHTTCTFVYSQEKDTVINEWNLLCDMKGIKPLITAIQMTGVLIGAFLSGQSADVIGRKKTLYVSLFLHGGFNLVAAFSVSWEMFIVLRFCIGLMVGAVLVVSFPYPMEFVGLRWRPVTISIPFWAGGSALLALTCWLRPNWSDLHIILAALHIPFFLGYIFVPESLRWLAVHGKLTEAEKVVDQMARYNRTQKPANTAILLRKLAEEEKSGRNSNRKYNYSDIYRGWGMCRVSLVHQVVWMIMSFTYYGISFGVGRLTGNLYLNMFLVSMVSVPSNVLAFFMNNRIGRRWTGFSFFLLATCGAFGVAIVSRFVASESTRGAAIVTLALICRLGVASAWSCFLVFTSESYPTVIRNLGYGAANTAARVGGIVSPYAFAVGGDDLLLPFVIVGSLMFVCSILSLLSPETMGLPLADTTVESSGKSNTTETATDKKVHSEEQLNEIKLNKYIRD
ncbi:solute carrier family 22 member 5-like isoform X2 [Haliotis rubra]|uniref:solute carrier family 22 member 5-like isoform X2 n=1 Tax=Haliotis rubra TaxID=36100 RepID=UPI001EE59F91|nr:solute carrier family 22 member 5-like isoform X2 [Haliotis rubra]